MVCLSEALLPNSGSNYPAKTEAPICFAGEGPWGVWEILWKAGAGEGPLQRRTFEASTATRTFLHKWVENWQQGGGAESGIRSPVAAPGPGPAIGGEAAAADLRTALEAVAAEGTLQKDRQDADDQGEAALLDERSGFLALDG